jgi:BASS family bile acid:Na+ symporter
VREFFEIGGQIAILVFVVTCMATAGLELRVRDIVAPFRRKRLLAVALVLNFVIAPAAAYGLARLFALDPPYATGLLLLGVAAGAPFLPKLAQLAKGDVAYSVGLMLLLTVGTVVFLPIGLPMLVPGGSVDTWPILRPLLFTMLLPLSTGMAIRGRFPQWAERVMPAFRLLSNISLVLTIVILIGLNIEGMIGTFGSGAVAAAMLFMTLLLACGYAFGGPAAATRSVLGLGTAQRNIAAALIVATQVSDDPAVTIMLIASTLSGLIVLAPVALWLARRSVVMPISSTSQLVITIAEEVV